MKFRSAVDWWFYAGSIPVVGIAVVVLPAVLPLGGAAAAITLLSLGGTLGLIFWILFSTYYQVDSEALVIHCGPFRWRVPRAEIKFVRSSRSVTSSPALSLRRLQINYGLGESILVSPADMVGFLKALGCELDE